VLSGRGLCDGPSPSPEESYRLWCVFECDQVKIKTPYTCCERVCRRGKDCETKFVGVTWLGARGANTPPVFFLPACSLVSQECVHLG
jgi:hypothetical protein